MLGSSIYSPCDSPLLSQQELKSKQKQLIGQLQAELLGSLGPPLRTALGQSLVAVYAVGDTFSLTDTVGKCCEVIKAKEDIAAFLINKL